MHHSFEDNIKLRLTDRMQLLRAVEKLVQYGVPEDLIPVWLSRAFYVDIDELNAVLKMMASHSQGGGGWKDNLNAVA